MKARNTVLAAVLLAAFSATTTTATVTPLPPNTTLFAYDTTLPSWFGGLGGTQLGHLVSPFFGGPISGSLESWVYQNTGDQSLGFAYQWTVTTKDIQNSTIKGATSQNWKGITIFDAGSAASLTQKNPLAINRENTVNGEGINVYWSLLGMGSALLPGDVSGIAFFVTDATGFTPDNVGIIDGGGANAAGLMPTVPEPGMLARMGLLGLGLAGFWGYRRSKK